MMHDFGINGCEKHAKMACKECKPIPEETTMPKIERLERMDRPPNTNREVLVIFSDGSRFTGFFIRCSDEEWTIRDARGPGYRNLDEMHESLKPLGWRELQPYALPLELPDGWHECNQENVDSILAQYGKDKAIIHYAPKSKLWFPDTMHEIHRMIYPESDRGYLWTDSVMSAKTIPALEAYIKNLKELEGA